MGNGHIGFEVQGAAQCLFGKSVFASLQVQDSKVALGSGKFWIYSYSLPQVSDLLVLAAQMVAGIG